MNPNRSLLLLSMVLNAALVAGVVYFLWPAKGPVATATATPRGELSPPAAPAVDAVSEPPAVTMVTNRFQWRELESTDYEVFVANLREVLNGCNTTRSAGSSTIVGASRNGDSLSGA